MIANGSSSPAKTYSNKNGYVNGTICNGTESHKLYPDIANGVNHNNNTKNAASRNGHITSNGHVKEKTSKPSQPESQHIKVSELF